MSRSDIIDDDEGWEALMRATDGEREFEVVVGVLGSSDEAVAQYAAYNEFGTTREVEGEDGEMVKEEHVPERSFLRAAFDARSGFWKQRADVELARAMLNGSSLEDALKPVGDQMQADVRWWIVNLKEPENAPSTIAAKGSSNPLIDSGTLRQSIHYQIRTGITPDVNPMSEGGDS